MADEWKSYVSCRMVPVSVTLNGTLSLGVFETFLMPIHQGI